MGSITVMYADASMDDDAARIRVKVVGDLIKSKEFYGKAISSEYISEDLLEKVKSKLMVLASG